MKREPEKERAWTRIIVSAAVGAAAMYALDPDKGRRRRALARDKARSLMVDTRDAVGVTKRDVTHRIDGLRARARHLLFGRPAPDDLQLIERVRARMGRVVSHPHAIQVGALQGRVTLSGPILAHEAEPVLDTVRTVWGVSDVEDRLVVHERPDSIPSLQGGSGRRKMRSEQMQQNWPPALRAAAVLGGALMALYGMRQRTFAGRTLLGVGLGLTARGATNLPLKRLADIATGHCAIDLEKTVHLAASPEVVYDSWTDWENFPRFMSHVQQVRDLGGGRTHWVVRGPSGAQLEWDAMVRRSIRPELLSWQTEPGSPVQHTGTVRFEPSQQGTRVSVNMTYDAGVGLGHALATSLGRDPGQQLNEDLARMKTIIEQGMPPAAASRDRQATSSMH